MSPSPWGAGDPVATCRCKCRGEQGHGAHGRLGRGQNHGLAVDWRAATRTAGQVLFDGQDVGLLDTAGLFAARRRMGMLFQFGALFTDLSVFENVAFPLREHTDLSGSPDPRCGADEAERRGFARARDLLPSQISGGMARRVALARAIALDPELIMYDEPFAGLDPISLGTTAQLIRQLNDAMG